MYFHLEKGFFFRIFFKLPNCVFLSVQQWVEITVVVMTSRPHLFTENKYVNVNILNVIIK